MEQLANRMKNQSMSLQAIAGKAYALVAAAFPVCTYSDEFYFFPQVLQNIKDWRSWDDFSAARVDAVADSLQGFVRELSGLVENEMSGDDRIDAELVRHALGTLREQLIEIGPHRTQPTFHLTVLSAGLAEALACPGQEAWGARVAGVPAFLQRAAQCLHEVPVLFHALGVEMLRDIQAWLGRLQADGFDIGEIPTALQIFQAALQRVDVVESYLLSEQSLESLVSNHLGCAMSIDAIGPLLHDELHMMEDLLAQQTARLVPGRHWTEAGQQAPFIEAGKHELLMLYRRELKLMESHCREQGMVPEHVSMAAPLEIAMVPAFLAAIRASDAYSATPGYPPRGGVFYVMAREPGVDGKSGRYLEYRMTSAHEAWPGHHLLDSCRWALPRALRRPLESPLFYEGWACLAEELMARTGFFDGPWDCFLLARRRAERAARGLIDLGLQSGGMTIEQAAELLVQVGYPTETARAVVPKYLLRPGYQVCYTLGLKQGLELLDGFAHNDIGLFARTLLSQGEIGFARLKIMMSVV